MIEKYLFLYSIDIDLVRIFPSNSLKKMYKNTIKNLDLDKNITLFISGVVTRLH